MSFDSLIAPSKVACIISVFYHAKPALQRVLVPMLSRVDSVRRANGTVVGIHVRSGYADSITKQTKNTADQPNPKTTADHASQTDAELWAALDLQYPECPNRHPRLGVCFNWTAPTVAHIHSRGVSCASQNQIVTPLVGLGSGLFSSLIQCAVLLNNSDKSPVLIFVAGDLPPFIELVRRHPYLSTLVITSAGHVGHVNSNWLCNQGTCTTGKDPGGAWTRTFSDAWMLGVVDDVLRYGATTFIHGAVLGRTPWKKRSILIFEV